MEFPETIRLTLEAQVQRYGTPACAQAARQLSLRYRSEGGGGKRLAVTGAEVAAYAVTRMPATFGAVYSALRWSLACVRCRPASLLDAGAGTGAASLAAAALLPLQKAVLLEREEEMIRLGRSLLESASLPCAEWRRGDIRDGLPLRAGLVVSSYMLNELSETELPQALKNLWDAAGEMLLLVEPGTPAGFSILRRAREQLTGQGAFVAAPCPHARSCPLPEGDWCHFTCRVARSRLHKQFKGGEAPFEDEKFSYLALVREPAQPVSARILRHPYKETGKITLQLCTNEGICPAAIRKRDGAAFKSARKAVCGDAFDFPALWENRPESAGQET